MRKLLNSELERKSAEEFRRSAKAPLVIILDNVRSQANVGSVFRTADAFMVKAIYLCGITSTPPHREIRKTALGATESVEWKYFPSSFEAVNELKSSGYTIVSVEQAEGAFTLDSFPVDKNASYALIFGHEVKGVDQGIIDISDACIEIPQFGTKHSFNIAVSAGIVLWELSKALSLIAVGFSRR